MKFSITSPTIALLAATCSHQLFSHHVSAQIAELCESTIPYEYNSGHTSKASTTISYPSSPWIQLDLSKTELAPTAKLILTGMNTSQELDASALALDDYSAMFDGDSVTIELVTPEGGSGLFRGGKGGVKGKGDPKSQVIVSTIKVGVCKDDLIAKSICGDVDDRIPSTDDRQGRISSGCTGWLISEDVFIQAGHCGTPSSSTRLHFTYLRTSAPVQDQYSVDVSTYRGLNAGVGSDWGVGRLLPNTSTDKLPGLAQSEKCGGSGCGWYTLGDVPSATGGNNIRITGYGTAAVNSQSQKTHVGALANIADYSLQYVPDTTGGNSGSPVIHEETGHVIGVHTHGGCSATGGANQGTRIDRPDFVAHIDFLTKSCTENSDCGDDNCVNGVETCNSSGRCACALPPPAPCTAKALKVEITTDKYPFETSWSLTNKCTEEVIGGIDPGDYTSAQTQMSETYCAADAKYEFTINDSYGDGICCGHGSGSYTVTFDGDGVLSGGEFAYTETKSWGSCDGGPQPTPPPTTSPPTTSPPTTSPPTTSAPTTSAPTTSPPTTSAPTTSPPTTSPPTTSSPTTSPPTNQVTTLPPTPTGGQVIALFDDNYAVPACSSVGTSCSSGQLLDGKAANREPNPPNTLDDCVDGPYGSYHGDESIDKITVAAVGEGQLKTGSLAEITAIVWAWGSGSADTADFYYAADASNSTWVLAGSRPAGGSGLRALSVQYTLPSGSSTQAVRVNFRYFGTQSSCSGGNWDDVDDLVFTVAQTEGVTTMKPNPVPPLTPIESTICASIDAKERCNGSLEGSSTLCEWKTGRGHGRSRGRSLGRGGGRGKRSDKGPGKGPAEGCYPALD